MGSKIGESHRSANWGASQSAREPVNLENRRQGKGSACGPVIVPVFKTGGRRLSASSMGSTPIRFRHFVFNELHGLLLAFQSENLESKSVCCDRNVIGSRFHTPQEASALGSHTVCWIWFDEPQFDADGDGPYSGGQIWESALSLLTDRPN